MKYLKLRDPNTPFSYLKIPKTPGENPITLGRGE